MGRTTFISDILDEGKFMLETNPHNAGLAIAFLQKQLFDLKVELTAEQWETLILSGRQHPVCQLLHQDPLTARAYRKPRGYQGDAELLDMIYQSDFRPFWPTIVSDLGENIFRFTIQCKAPAAVRTRRAYLAEQLNHACQAKPNAHILSVACGHLREALASSAIQARSFGRYVGLDHDPLTLDVLSKNLGKLGVQTIRGSVKALMSSPLSNQRFDFIYSAGLYDYLEERLCQRLTEKMFEMLNPGGRLLVANFMRYVEDVGYMEMFEDWRLIYRDNESMSRMIVNIPEKKVARVNVSTDSTETILYLDIRAVG